jgi:hypothetical protein
MMTLVLIDYTSLHLMVICRVVIPTKASVLSQRVFLWRQNDVFLVLLPPIQVPLGRPAPHPTLRHRVRVFRILTQYMCLSKARKISWNYEFVMQRDRADVA